LDASTLWMEWMEWFIRTACYVLCLCYVAKMVNAIYVRACKVRHLAKLLGRFWSQEFCQEVLGYLAFNA